MAKEARDTSAVDFNRRSRKDKCNNSMLFTAEGRVRAMQLICYGGE